MLKGMSAVEMGSLILFLLLWSSCLSIDALDSSHRFLSNVSVQYFDYPEEITCTPLGVMVRIRNDSFQGMFIRLSVVDNYGIPRDLRSLPRHCPYTTTPKADGSLIFNTPYNGCYVHVMNNTVSMELRIDGIDESKRIIVIERIPVNCTLPSLALVTVLPLTVSPTIGIVHFDQKPANATTPVSVPVDQKPANATTPVSVPVDQKPANATTPVSVPVDQKPANATTPVSVPVDLKPANATTPVSVPVDLKPANATTPVSVPVDLKPANATTPVSVPVDLKPANATTPVSVPVDLKPANATTPVSVPVDLKPASATTPVSVPVDLKPANATTPVSVPVDLKPANATTPVSVPVDLKPANATTPVSVPVDLKPANATTPVSVPVDLKPANATTPVSVPVDLKPANATTPVSVPVDLKPANATTPVSVPVDLKPANATTPVSVPVDLKPANATTPVSVPVDLKPANATTPVSVPVDLKPANATTPVSVPVDLKPANATTPVSVPVDLKPANATTPVSVPVDLKPVNATTPVSVPVDLKPVNATTPVSVPVDQKPANATTPVSVPVDQKPANATTPVSVPVDQKPVNATTPVSVPVDQKPVNATTPVSVPVDQKPVNATTPVSVPVDLKPVRDITQICDVDAKERVGCGNATIDELACNAKGCCYDPINEQTPCFYGKTAYIDCTTNGLFTIVVPRVATVPPLNLGSVSLVTNSSECAPAVRTTEFVIFSFPLDSCGTTQMINGLNITYKVDIMAKRKIQTGLRGSITRDSTFRLQVICHFPGNKDIPLRVEVNTPLPLPSIVKDGFLKMEMRIAKEASFRAWYADEDYPIVKFLREPVYVEVRLLNRADANIALVLNDCWATQTLDPDHGRQWPIIVNGCPYYRDNYLTQLHAVNASFNLQFPTHHKRFEVKTFTFWGRKTQMLLSGEVYFHCSATVCLLTEMDNCATTCGARKRIARNSNFNTSIETLHQGLVTLKRPIIFNLAEENVAESSQANENIADGVLLAAAVTSLVLALICGLVLCWNCKQMHMS